MQAGDVWVPLEQVEDPQSESFEHWSSVVVVVIVVIVDDVEEVVPPPIIVLVALVTGSPFTTALASVFTPAAVIETS